MNRMTSEEKIALLEEKVRLLIHQAEMLQALAEGTLAAAMSYLGLEDNPVMKQSLRDIIGIGEQIREYKLMSQKSDGEA